MLGDTSIFRSWLWRHFAILLFFCLMPVPLFGTIPGWGTTRARIKVFGLITNPQSLSSEPTIVELGEIPKGTRIQVLRSDGGWYYIPWSDPRASVYVVSPGWVLMEDEVLPAVDDYWFWICGSIDINESRCWIEGTYFPNGTVLTHVYSKLDGNLVIVVGPSGTDTIVAGPATQSQYFPVKWDTAADNIYCPVSKVPAIIVSYYSLLKNFTNGFLGLTFSFCVLSGLHILSAIYRERYSSLWAMLLLAVPATLALLYLCVDYDAAIQRCEDTRHYIAAHQSADGRVLPLPDASAISIDQFYDDTLAIDLFIIGCLHPLYFILIARAFRGLHFLLVPHPVERIFKKGATPTPLNEIVVTMGHDVDEKQPAPEYRSRSWQRRMEALKKRVDAETDFLESEIRNRRVRAALEEDDE